MHFIPQIFVYIEGLAEINGSMNCFEEKKEKNMDICSAYKL